MSRGPRPLTCLLVSIVRALVKLLMVLTFAAALAELRRMTHRAPAAGVSFDQWPDVVRKPAA